MKRIAFRINPGSCLRGMVWGCCVFAAISGLDSARASDLNDELLVEGFTEPYKTVEVAAPDPGIVDQMHVIEGQVVKVGELLTTLDQEVHQAQVVIARENAATTGKLQSVQAELALRRDRLSKLEKLGTQGHARAEEVERARVDVRLGEADLLAAKEDQLIRNRELERALILLERRQVRSKLNGVVTKIHKEPGEFVAANDPVVVTVVQLDPLRLSLSVPRNQAVLLKEKQMVSVRFEATQIESKAQVEFVSPLTDAESSTVNVRVTIANPAGKFRAGDRCMLDLRGLSPEPAASRQAGQNHPSTTSVKPPKSNSNRGTN
jgi:RND family efflux transporter MFP subunit